MNKLLKFAAVATLMTGATTPAHAAFYFEGLTPFQDAPNCNDPYATTCGRYGHVPHDENGPKVPHPHPHVEQELKVPEAKPHKPGVRLNTRDVLDK